MLEVLRFVLAAKLPGETLGPGGVSNYDFSEQTLSMCLDLS